MDTLYFDWLDSPADVDKAIDLDEFTIKDVILYDCSQNYSAGMNLVFPFFLIIALL